MLFWLFCGRSESRDGTYSVKVVDVVEVVAIGAVGTSVVGIADTAGTGVVAISTAQVEEGEEGEEGGMEVEGVDTMWFCFLRVSLTLTTSIFFTLLRSEAP